MMNSDNKLHELLIETEGSLNKVQTQIENEQKAFSGLSATFRKNIAAFRKFIPSIADEFEDYQAKSVKLIVSPSGDLNILDKKTGLPLYADDPKKQCKEQIDQLRDNPQFTRVSFSTEIDAGNNFIHTKYMGEMYRIYEEADEVLTPISKIPDHLGSMIMFGVGLGYQLPYLLEMTTIDHLYICEPSMDWFFASLYVCDWLDVLETLDKKGGQLKLNIGVGYEQFTGDFINELKDKGSFNAVNAIIYQHYPSEDITNIITKFEHDFHMVTIGWGFFDDGVISIAHDFENVKKGIPTLKENAILPRKYQDTPLFIVANGPSFDVSLELIKTSADNVVIFSCGTALIPLLENGIVPDFHIEVERTKLTYDCLVNFLDKEQLKKINFLSVNVMYPDTFDLFKWSGMAFKPAEPSTVLSKYFIPGGADFAEMKFCNPLVANTALAYACKLGFNDIYLLGVDNGYRNPEHHHSKSSFYYDKKGNEKEAIGKLVRAGEITVEANFGGVVFSTAYFNTGRFYMERLLKSYPKIHCYNCADGSKVEGAEPLLVEDVLLMKNLSKKDDLINYIKTEMFSCREFDEKIYSDWLAIPTFNEICDEMIRLINIEFTSREEISLALREQARYLFSYCYTKYRHLYFLMEGTVTYAHSVLRLILYSFESEAKTVGYCNKTLNVYIEYLTEAKKKYSRVLSEKDVHNSYFIGLL